MTKLTPPPIFKKPDASVFSLLVKLSNKTITVDEISRAFIEDVVWDYQTNPNSRAIGSNLWEVVYKAMKNGIMTPAEYIQIANNYEQAIYQRELALYEG
jgi:hypothetical protein